MISTRIGVLVSVNLLDRIVREENIWQDPRHAARSASFLSSIKPSKQVVSADFHMLCTINIYNTTIPNTEISRRCEEI